MFAIITWILYIAGVIMAFALAIGLLFLAVIMFLFVCSIILSFCRGEDPPQSIKL